MSASTLNDNEDVLLSCEMCGTPDCFCDAIRNCSNPNLKFIYLNSNQEYLKPTEETELKIFLVSIGFEKFYDYFLENKIFVSELKILKTEFIPILLKNYTWGDIINFDHKLKNWQNSLTEVIPILSPQISSSTVSSSNSKEPANQSSIQLYNILQDTPQGRDIYLLHNDPKKKLNDVTRQILVDVIINFFIRNDFKMSIKNANTLSDQIGEMFPQEKNNTCYYFEPTPKGNPKGRLYNKFQNVQSRMKAGGLRSKLNKNGENNLNKENKTLKKFDDIDDKTVEDHILALKHEHLKPEEFIIHWKGCLKSRYECIKSAEDTKQVLKFWPYYQEPNGYIYIDSDFADLFEDEKKIFGDLETFYNSMMDVFHLKIKEPTARKFYLELKENEKNTSENGKNLGIFLLLHAVLRPTSRAVTKHDNHKVVKKCSIKDSQNAFLYHAATTTDMEEHLTELEQQKIDVQPFIITIGSNIFNPLDILVYYDGIKYRVPTIIKAIDICFKIFHVFNFKYTESCCAIWQFIEKKFYNIKNSYPIFPSVKLLINLLNEHLNTNN